MQAIQLKELKKIALLGAGAFGQVFLVKHNTKYYALKCLSKALVLETGLQVLPCRNSTRSLRQPAKNSVTRNQNFVSVCGMSIHLSVLPSCLCI